MRHEPNTLTLFPDYAAPTAPRDRRGVIKRAFERADKYVISAYRQVLMDYGRVNPTFGAWEITAAYIAKHGALSEANKKALGGLFGQLLERGIIEEAGTGKRPNGNLASVYRLKGGVKC